MKKSLLAVAVAAALPAFAQAQTAVTLYGIADAGITFADRGGSVGGVDFKNAMRIDSGVMSTSRFGLRGTEDLGGGLSAVFNIEGGYKQDDGTSDANGGGLFQRRAVVGLGGGFGTVLLGRDYTPGFSVAGSTDLMGYGLYGNWLTFTVQPTGAGATGGILTRASNGIHYTSPNWGGLTLKAMYSTGERDTDPTRLGDVYSIAGTYAAGPLNASAYYQTLKVADPANANSTVSDKQYGIGAGWNFGAFRVMGNYGVSDPNGGNTATSGKLTGIGAGVGVKLGAGEVLFNVIRLKIDLSGANGPDPKGTAFGLAYVYPMSKRTTLYATFGTTRNNDTGGFILRASDYSIAPSGVGEDPKALTVGLRHTF